MLFIVYRDTKAPNRGPLERDWHVGMVIPEVPHDCIVEELQADGHELQYIRAMFPYITAMDIPVVRYTGEFARLIYANLYLLNSRVQSSI